MDRSAEEDAPRPHAPVHREGVEREGGGGGGGERGRRRGGGGGRRRRGEADAGLIPHRKYTTVHTFPLCSNPCAPIDHKRRTYFHHHFHAHRPTSYASLAAAGRTPPCNIHYAYMQ